MKCIIIINNVTALLGHFEGTRLDQSIFDIINTALNYVSLYTIIITFFNLNLRPGPVSIIGLVE